ncbi:hypothetical protein ACMDB5_12150 [Flavobacterium sp. W1B]|uniref:hypothetical protein n=1 Tax=Flavobacterium sp. W1B TaxID=3394146 RepID=UPI0039BC3B02
MKKLILFISLVGFLSFFNSCSVGYVSEQPQYQYYNRPVNPGAGYIWIDGGWSWDSRARNYRQRDGYWTRQNDGRNHSNGYWKKTNRGYQWRNGRR